VLLDGYVRVSQVAGRGGESFISPAVQREQIEAWAKVHGATLGHVFEELDQSGARADRPMLTEALARAERGDSQGIVVAKLDRFGRSLIDGLANIERLGRAGATFVSVADGLDISTPTGKLVIRIMLSMAEWELDRIRENWAVARARAIGRGVHPTAAPFGYRRRGDGRLVPEEPAAALVAEVFRRRAEGETLGTLLDLLNASGLRTRRGGAFVETSLRGILANRTYLGEVRWAGHSNPEAHVPLVDRATWQLAQSPLRFQSNRRTSLLGGILRCGSCRMKMSVESGVFRHGTHGSVYRCPGRTSAGPCPAPARVGGEEIEGLVEELVLSLARHRRADVAPARTRAAEKAMARAEHALERYRDDSGAVTALTPERFADGLRRRQRDVETVALELAAAAREVPPEDEAAGNLEAVWTALAVKERRSAIEERIDCIFVMAGEGPVRGRAWVLRRGRGPADVPRRGVPIGELRPFKPDAGSGATRLPRPRRWAPGRIEAELRTWREGSREWPSYAEFLLAGRARLHRQILGYGGARYWARRLGWDGAPRTTRWDEETILGGLRPILAGREVWPSAAEFRELGLEGLRRAVIRHGGITLWAARSGLRMRPGSSEPATPLAR
jgi:DNA invertase Pin-like site-specific DNA recombinase